MIRLTIPFLLALAAPTNGATQTEQPSFFNSITKLFSKKPEMDSREETRKELFKSVDLAWQKPEFEEEKNSTTYHYKEDNSIQQKLESIKIPKIQFTETPLGRVVNMLSELSIEFDPEGKGVNMVLINPEGQDPLVSMTLRDSCLAQIIELVTKSTGFSYDIESQIVTLRKGGQNTTHLKTDFFPISRAAVLKMTGHRLRTENQSQGEEELLIKNFLQRSGIPFNPEYQGPEGAQFAFDGTQLIVNQTPRNLEKVDNLLARYTQTHQVEIESKFIEVQEGVLEELGLKWSATNNRHDKRFYKTFNEGVTPGLNNLRQLNNAFSGANNTSGDGKIFDTGGAMSQAISNIAPTFPNAINVGLNSSPVAGVLGLMNHWQLNAVIEALEQHTGADLMSSPKVTVLSGRTAKITVAQTLRYPEAYGDISSAVGVAGSDAKNSSAGVTITAGTPQRFVEKNVGVEMEVTPTVESDNRSVNLRLDPKVTEFEGFVEYGGRSIAISGGVTADLPSGFFQPIFSTREISTEVTIFDGATVVMGGLTREEVKTVQDKVPLLGDIPLLGRLFRSNGETNQKRNLLIFVTANIVTESGAPANNQLARLPTERVL